MCAGNQCARKENLRELARFAIIIVCAAIIIFIIQTYIDQSNLRYKDVVGD